MPRLLQRRTVVVPTLLGWICLILLVGAPAVGWWFLGEKFLSATQRLPAEVLLVEAWTGPDGARAAGIEFNEAGHKYEHVVVVGGFTGSRWTRRRWSMVEMAEHELSQCNVPSRQVIPVVVDDVESQRTFETAVAAHKALAARGIHPKAVNVFTRGAHARRSRLVFAKVFGSETEVGVVSWHPPGYDQVPWWRSSVRAQDFLTETVGYLFEGLLNSGRSSNASMGQIGGHAAASH